ncbi:MAG: hypothetical protein K0R66_722 [Gammaproteobacteria bacterium]|jgi:hypothetical protein|nr:hypothetical protein [Gammaproteobacteria bacterium]
MPDNDKPSQLTSGFQAAQKTFSSLFGQKPATAPVRTDFFDRKDHAAAVNAGNNAQTGSRNLGSAIGNILRSMGRQKHDLKENLLPPTNSGESNERSTSRNACASAAARHPWLCGFGIGGAVFIVAGGTVIGYLLNKGHPAASLQIGYDSDVSVPVGSADVQIFQNLDDAQNFQIGTVGDKLCFTVSSDTAGAFASVAGPEYFGNVTNGGVPTCISPTFNSSVDAIGGARNFTIHEIVPADAQVVFTGQVTLIQDGKSSNTVTGVVRYGAATPTATPTATATASATPSAEASAISTSSATASAAPTSSASPSVGSSNSPTASVSAVATSSGTSSSTASASSSVQPQSSSSTASASASAQPIAGSNTATSSASASFSVQPATSTSSATSSASASVVPASSSNTPSASATGSPSASSSAAPAPGACPAFTFSGIGETVSIKAVTGSYTTPTTMVAQSGSNAQAQLLIDVSQTSNACPVGAAGPDLTACPGPVLAANQLKLSGFTIDAGKVRFGVASNVQARVVSPGCPDVPVAGGPTNSFVQFKGTFMEANSTAATSAPTGLRGAMATSIPQIA